MEWKNKLKKLFLLLMPVFCVMTLAPVKKVEALSNSRLFMGVLLDTEREGVYIDVVEDKLVWKLDKWRRDDKKGYCGNFINSVIYRRFFSGLFGKGMG